MTNFELSQRYYNEMSLRFDRYLSIERVYKLEADPRKKIKIGLELSSAREDWFEATKQFREHLQYLRKPVRMYSNFSFDAAQDYSRAS